MSQSRSDPKPGFRIREDKQETIEVHVAGFCFRAKGRRLELLIAKRTNARDLFPGKWECGGGQVNPGESFTEALSRQYLEEFGIKVQVLFPISTYEIVRPTGPKIPGVKLLCRSSDNGEEEITLNTREFSEYRWVNEASCMKLSLISGVRADVKQAFAQAKNLFITPARERSRPSRRIGFGRAPEK